MKEAMEVEGKGQRRKEGRGKEMTEEEKADRNNRRKEVRKTRKTRNTGCEEGNQKKEEEIKKTR